jgi:hypothetical protein
MDILLGMIIGIMVGFVIAVLIILATDESDEMPTETAPPQETVCSCCATCDSDDDDWQEEMLAASALETQRELTRFWRNRALAVERGSMPVDDETRWRVSELERKVREQEGEL